MKEDSSGVSLNCVDILGSVTHKKLDVDMSTGKQHEVGQGVSELTDFLLSSLHIGQLEPAYTSHLQWPGFQSGGMDGRWTGFRNRIFIALGMTLQRYTVGMDRKLNELFESQEPSIPHSESIFSTSLVPTQAMQVLAAQEQFSNVRAIRCSMAAECG